ncbi:MAG TPA: PilZ domain-containing protein [Terriglobales bacterium]|nr:PilZ domain-containing protein [Terriglobales bacterium]
MPDLRSEPRVVRLSPVRVFGLDPAGHPVSQLVHTGDISKHGARIVGIRNWQTPGETIGVRYEREKARFKIIWVGKPGTPQDGHLGLRCVEPGKYIWGLSPGAAHAKITASAHHPAFSPTGESPRRSDIRFPIEAGSQVREFGTHIPTWVTVTDVSMGGCYAQTSTPFSLDTNVEITLHVGDVRIDACGFVVHSQPLAGMGIKFAEMTPLNREQLKHVIARLGSHRRSIAQ